jgi:formylglycine-generating enzyme required for sulfatase activity
MRKQALVVFVVIMAACRLRTDRAQSAGTTIPTTAVTAGLQSVESSNRPEPNPRPEPNQSLLSTRVFVPGGDLRGTSISSLYFDVTETTVTAYQDCIDKGVCPAISAGGPLKGCNSNIQRRGAELEPVNCVSRADAAGYCEWIGGRLPSVLEWEWEALGGEESRRYPWGEAPPSCEHANVAGLRSISGSECGMGLSNVGARPLGASRHGVLDMQGNVSEWTADSVDTAPIAKGAAIGWSNNREFLDAVFVIVDYDSPYGDTGFRCVYDMPERHERDWESSTCEGRSLLR